MPRNGGLSVASGVARGVSAFTQAYLQSSQQEAALKLAKNKPLSDLLLAQIEDGNTPHRQRTALVREYGKLYGQNDLDQILGLHKLDDEDYQVGTGQIKTNPPDIKMTPNDQGGVTTSSVPAPPSATTLENAPITKKYGDVTPNEIKQKLQLDLEAVRDKREIVHAKELYRAQTEILGKNGYNIPVSEAYDPETKTYRKVFANAAGETKEIKLENFKPVNLAKAEITAQSQSDKPSVFVRDQIRFWQTQVNQETGQPYSLEEAKFKALGDSHRKFTSTESLKEAQTTALNYGNEGIKPIQPSQKVDDTRALQQMQIHLQSRLDEFMAKSRAASVAARKAAYDLTDHWNNDIEPIKQHLATLDPDTQEYKDEQKRLDGAKSKHQRMKDDADDLVKYDQQLKDQTDSASKALSDFFTQNNISPNKEVSAGEKGKKALSKYQANIDQFKKDNPSSTLSDVEIVNYLRGKSIIK